MRTPPTIAPAATSSEVRATATTYLVARRRVILATAEQLLAARPSRYVEDGSEAASARLGVLFDRLVDVVATGDPQPLVDHASSVADARFHSGFGLGDVQAAYNALEEAIWMQVFDDDEKRDVLVLPIVSTALGNAKDVVAREYVTLAARMHAPAVDVTALFRGLERP